jgi:hypothetical protein
MPCFFSVAGKVASVSGSGSGRTAVILIQEGLLGGPGEDRYFDVNFWPEGDTNLITNKCYLLRGTVVLAEVLSDKREEPPKVISINLAIRIVLLTLWCRPLVSTLFLCPSLFRESTPSYTICTNDRYSQYC